MKTYICNYSASGINDNEIEAFICQADDIEHAREQCENAYPAAFITEIYLKEEIEMENLTTEQYAVLIADSIANGQRKQALDQFKRALADSVSADLLCEDIHGQGIESAKIFNLLCALVQERA